MENWEEKYPVYSISDNERIAYNNVVNTLKREDEKSYRLTTTIATILTAEIIGTAFLFESLTQATYPLHYGLYSIIFFTFISMMISAVNFFDTIFYDVPFYEVK